MSTAMRALVAVTVLLLAAIVGIAAGILAFTTDHSLVTAVVTGAATFGGTALFIVSFWNHVKTL